MVKYLMPFVLFLMTAPQAFAQDAARGQTLYQTCIQCHGEKGEGNLKMKAPRIGGQFDWYIITSINMFKSGERKNPTMQPFIKDLSDKDIADLAAFVSTLKSVAESPTGSEETQAAPESEAEAPAEAN